MLTNVFTALRAILYTAIFIWLWVWIGISLIRPLDAKFRITIPLWLAPFGWFFLAVGTLVVFACFYLFVSVGKGTPEIAPRRFVAVGPYRFVRNPMYIGGAAVILGCGLSVGSLSVLFFTLVFLSLAHGLIVREEPVLRRKFGSEGTWYCQDP